MCIEGYRSRFLLNSQQGNIRPAGILDKYSLSGQNIHCWLSVRTRFSQEEDDPELAIDNKNSPYIMQFVSF